MEADSGRGTKLARHSRHAARSNLPEGERGRILSAGTWRSNEFSAARQGPADRNIDHIIRPIGNSCANLPILINLETGDACMEDFVLAQMRIKQ